MTDSLLFVHAASTWFMVGLIWFVQIVHYPLFEGVGESGWATYAELHQERTTWVVMPVMLVELAATVALAMGLAGAPEPGRLAWTGAALLAVVWGSTFLLQVPLHAKLAEAKDDQVIASLVYGNWLRTFAWTGRGIVAMALLR